LVSWQSCELGLDSVDFFAMQGGGRRHTGSMPTDDKENTVYTERSEGKNRVALMPLRPTQQGGERSAR
ncbi:hypothetical protein SAMN04488502_11375, partial [Dendrosporobacter quercicolus]